MGRAINYLSIFGFDFIHVFIDKYLLIDIMKSALFGSNTANRNLGFK